jgi:tRNA dimethylallyltransferase
VYRGTGVPLSAWQRGEAVSQADQFECIALCTEPRAALHSRIERRLDGMFADGLIDEVRALMARGDCYSDLPAIRAVGYRQVWAYLQGEVDLPTCREKALAATRQLAKRQLTWLRSWPDLTWIIMDDTGRLIQVEKTATEPVRASGNIEIAAVEPVWADRIESLMRNF